MLTGVSFSGKSVSSDVYCSDTSTYSAEKVPERLPGTQLQKHLNEGSIENNQFS